MATISYKCDTCKRAVELVENPQGFTVVGKCVITNGCTGRLYRTERNPNNVRESSPSYVEGLTNYVPRRAFYKFAQTLSSNKWKVTHNMGVLPSTFVYLEQENGSFVATDNSTYKVTSVDKNTIMITFPQKVKGIIQCVAKSTVPLVPSTIPKEINQYQVSANGIITFAVPKYLTQVHGQIPVVSAPTVTPTLTPSPTPTTTPITLPLNLCAESSTIQIEIEITKPNEDPFVCFEDIENFTDNRSPWNGWGEVLVGKRRNYCVRTASLLKLKVFGNANLEANDIPNGTRIRFLRIDYGTGRKEEIPSRGLLMLLAKSPYAYADKVKDKVVDVGELIGDTPDYFVYNDGELFLDETKVERSYPDISRVIYQAAPPAPSPTPTPTLTPTITPTITISPSISASPAISATPTPTVGVTHTRTPTPTVTPTITPSPTAGSFNQPFDFALIRYTWTIPDGRDLDTRTAITTPARNIDVGWNRSNTDGNYLIWGGDNTSELGPEAVLVDFNKLVTDFPSITDFVIRLRTFWYGTRVTGNVGIVFQSYLGGTMQHVGTDFVNVGGTLVNQATIYINSPTQTSSNVDGDDIGTLTYDSTSKTATFQPLIPAITPTPTPTISVTPSVTPSITPTISVTPSVTPTISITPTITPTISITPSITPTISITPTSTSIIPSVTPTTTRTPTVTPTIAASNTVTPTITPTPTQLPSYDDYVIAIMNPDAPTNNIMTDMVGRTYSLTDGATIIEDVPEYNGSLINLANDTATVLINSATVPEILNNDFTVEAYVTLLTALPSTVYGYGVIGTDANNGTGWQLRMIEDELVWVYPALGGMGVPVSWNIGQQYHIAACRQGTQHYLAIDGVVTPITIANRTGTTNTELRMGRQSYGAGATGGMYVAHRVSVGVARYTSNFTVPGLQFKNSVVPTITPTPTPTTTPV